MRRMFGIGSILQESTRHPWANRRIQRLSLDPIERLSIPSSAVYPRTQTPRRHPQSGKSIPPTTLIISHRSHRSASHADGVNTTRGCTAHAWSKTSVGTRFNPEEARDVCGIQGSFKILFYHSSHICIHCIARCVELTLVCNSWLSQMGITGSVCTTAVESGRAEIYLSKQYIHTAYYSFGI